MTQASISAILQRYKETNQRYASDKEYEILLGQFDTAQRAGVDDKELLQGKLDSLSHAEQAIVQREDKPDSTGLPDNLKKVSKIFQAMVWIM